MSIASEFDSTIENIKSDYEGLENIGADLTNVNKNIQNIRTCLDNIYTNLPKTTGEGSNLSLTTLKGRINVDDILGDTEQETTNGYQLLDLTLAKLKTYNTSGTWNNNVYTISGLTITINDDMSIKVNGTTTAQVGLLIAGGAIPYPTGTYYLSGAINGSNDTYDVRIFNYNGTSAVAQCFTGTKQVAIVNNSQSFNMAVIVRNGVTCNNTMFYPMLSTTNTSDYEPYTNGASPNPTYPQDINVVTGTQEVVVQNKNLFNKDTITENQRIDPSGNKNYDENCDLSDYIKIQPNTTYTRNITASVYECIAFYTSEKVFISRDTTHSTTTSPSNAYYVRISCYKTNLDTLQFEVGSTSTSYVEHQEQTKTLHLGDIELSKIGSYQDRIFETSGKNLFDGQLELGSIDASTGEKFASTTFYRSANFTKVEPETQYTLSINGISQKYCLYYYNSSKAIISYDTSLTTGTFTTPANAEYIMLRCFQSDFTSNYANLNVQLEEGTSATSYEPYGSDKWYIEKKNKQITLGNVPEIQTGDIFGVTCKYAVYRGISDMRRTTTQSYDFYCNRVSKSNGVATKYSGYSVAQNIVVILDDNDTLESASEKLNGSIFYYPLATPTYTEITNETLLNELNELEKMMSYNGQTNISVSGNLPMILDISALKGE